MSDEGHNIRACPFGDVPYGPWFQDPDDRWHTKIVSVEDWPGSRVKERDHRLPQRHRVDSGTLTTNDVGCSGGGFSLHQNSCAAARSARPEKR